MSGLDPLSQRFRGIADGLTGRLEDSTQSSQRGTNRGIRLLDELSQRGVALVQGVEPDRKRGELASAIAAIPRFDEAAEKRDDRRRLTEAHRGLEQTLHQLG